MKKQYLPRSVYNVWIGTSLSQAISNVYFIFATDSEHRLNHLFFVLIHLGLAALFFWQQRKAQSYAPPVTIHQEKSLTVRQAKIGLAISVLLATIFEIFCIGFTINMLRINADYHLPLTFGNILTQFSLHLTFLSVGFAPIAVMQRTLKEARQARKTVILKEAPPQVLQTVWWTQDETRQEIRWL